FYAHYKKEYYREQLDHLSAMKMSIHNMLHISKSIFETGPCCMIWQYLIERFNKPIDNQIFLTIPPKIHDEYLAYTGESSEDFYFPSVQYNLTQTKQEQNMDSSELKMATILGQN
ncbi:6644_t:CDS:2, partial [Dentiscutata erythropus]